MLSGAFSIAIAILNAESKHPYVEFRAQVQAGADSR